MAPTPNTVLLRGGLNLVVPPIAVPAGQCSATLNYLPDVMGYARIGGIERFDGQPAPSEGVDPADIADRRAAIGPAPGAGSVRGVAVYNGRLVSWRNTVGGAGGMYTSSPSGWTGHTYGYEVAFTAGTAEFFEGDVLTGGSSSATATIERVVLRGGSWGDGDAYGYFVISDLIGSFQVETGTSDSGSATISPQTSIALSAGGKYDSLVHNFYGAAKRPRLYFVNGVGTGFEWDGEVLAPIRTGNVNGALDDVIAILARNGATIIGRSGDTLVGRGENDKPSHVGQYSNHLFLSYDAGAIINSGIGEPLVYTAIAGAAEFAFNGAVTNFITAASTSMVVFGLSRIEYIVGSDSSDFLMKPISDRSGAVEWTAQMANGPVYLDEGGLRRLSATDAFGDWRMGSLTQAVEPLFQAKKAAGVAATASLVLRAKDQYWLFFNDMSGVVSYFGAKQIETMPFILPFQVTCACAGEFDPAEGERYFVGASNGYVYELNKGTSFDGAKVQAYIRFPWNTVGQPNMEKRFHTVKFDLDTPDAVEFGVLFDVDFNIPGNPGGPLQDVDVPRGSQSLIPLDYFENVDWTPPVQGELWADLDGIGTSCAVTLLSETADEQPHTLQAMTMFVSPRRMRRRG